MLMGSSQKPKRNDITPRDSASTVEIPLKNVSTMPSLLWPQDRLPSPFLGNLPLKPPLRKSLKMPCAFGKLTNNPNIWVCTLGCMATLHTVSPVHFPSLRVTLTSQSETSFLVPTRIPGIPDSISTLIDSGATSNFIDSSLASMSIFVPSALAQPIALSLFDGKPAMSGFIHQSISTTVQFSDESTQELDLLVTKLQPSAPIVLGLPWLQKTNLVVDWENWSLTFRTGPKSALPPMTVAMSCVTTAPRHEDITPHISPLFASIPELQSKGILNPTDLSCPVVSGNTANSGTVIPTDSSNVAGISCSVNSSNAANKNISGNPATLNYTLGGFCKDPPGFPMISGHVLNRT